ncbi:hypothetical protein BDP27DRAFT_1422510 [Rhodocollybia butyracea]|uniref:Uncharacterized protein n=1 Tax=Rhodocollybia butyracea TaxID=206335 RepID=A0A9P5U7D5_9AGAR|nr:hypothetical protein BDP27DRAFT_1422510 [Rhodocollybia butyracea]
MHYALRATLELEVPLTEDFLNPILRDTLGPLANPHPIETFRFPATRPLSPLNFDATIVQHHGRTTYVSETELTQRAHLIFVLRSPLGYSSRSMSRFRDGFDGLACCWIRAIYLVRRKSEKTLQCFSNTQYLQFGLPLWRISLSNNSAAISSQSDARRRRFMALEPDLALSSPTVFFTRSLHCCAAQQIFLTSRFSVHPSSRPKVSSVTILGRLQLLSMYLGLGLENYDGKEW